MKTSEYPKMAALKNLLLIFFLSTLGYAGPIQFSGSASTDAELDSIQGAPQGRPTTNLSLTLNPTVTVYGMPISFNFYLTSQESNLRQQLDKYRLLLQPSKLSRDLVALPDFVFSISSLELGTCSPAYSALTLSGVSVTGAAIEMNPGLFYLAATAGQSQRAVIGSDSTDAAYSRILVSGRLGIGKKDKSHFFITVLHAQDDPNSIPPYTLPIHRDTTDTLAPDTVEVLTPEENYLAGADAKLSLLADHIALESEISGSDFTRDVRAQEMNLIGIPKQLTDLLHPRLSTSFDYAYALKPTVIVLGTKLYGSLQMIGPGYASLGVTSLRNDLLSFETGIERSFFANALSLAGSYTSEHDNLINWKSTTTYYTSYNLRFGINFARLPAFQLVYSPYFQKSLTTDTRGDIINGSTAYTFQTRTLTHTLNFSIAYQNTRESLTTTSSSISYLPSYTLNFGFPLSLTANFEIDRSRSQIETDRNFAFDLNGSYTAFSTWTNTAGFNRTTGASQTRKTGFYFNSSVSLPIIGTLNLRAEQDLYRDIDPTKNYTELLLRANLSKNW